MKLTVNVVTKKVYDCINDVFLVEAVISMIEG